MNVYLRNVQVGKTRADVLLASGRVAAIHPAGRMRWPVGIEIEIDGAGGSLIPGLHDHHVHLAAWAAALGSVDCSPGVVTDIDALTRALRTAPADGWIRGVGYHESTAGPLDRHVLDRLITDRPVRIQHRSGALWMLNSRALEEVTPVLDDTDDVERHGGQPTGRLWRYDARLRPAISSPPPDLSAVGSRLARLGITGVTDATPDLDTQQVAMLEGAVQSGDLPKRLVLLGASDDVELTAAQLGPRKVLLRDHDLPTYEALHEIVSRTHARGRPVAVHCVTRESLLLTLAVLDDAGRLPGDRIEHASVVPDEALAPLRELCVVTQPGFLSSRGDTYLDDVAPDDLPYLYRHGTLLESGVTTVISSDAPFGDPDPWKVLVAAAERRAPSGRIIGDRERVSAAEALSGYHADPLALDARRSHVSVGDAADLVLLDEPLHEVLRHPSAQHVRQTFWGGRAASAD